MSGLTQFDFLVAALLVISAAVGFARGAVREIAAMVALVAAAALAIFGLPMTGPMARQFIGTPWLGTVAALVVVLAVALVELRLLRSED